MLLEWKSWKRIPATPAVKRDDELYHYFLKYFPYKYRFFTEILARELNDMDSDDWEF